MDIRCANCGGQIALERDEPFLVCAYCQSSLYLDRAQTFKSFFVPAIVTPRGAADRLAQELASREIPPVAVMSTEGLLAPFWGVRGEAVQETHPAFSPVPGPLQGYRLPSAEALPSDEQTQEAFASLPSCEGASSSWEGREDISSFALYRVPFFRLRFNAGTCSYCAWIDAVTGRVYLEDAPPPQSEVITTRFLAVIFGLFAVFSVAAAVVPGFGWSLLAVAFLAAASIPAVRRIVGEAIA